MTTTTTVTREAAEAVLAAVRKQFTVYCATHAEIAAMYPDDPDLVDVLTKDAYGNPRPENPQPTIVENFEWVKGMVAPFAIVWEEGPGGWAHNAMIGGVDEEMTALTAEAAAEFGGIATTATIDPADPIPDVETEPYTGWALGIYPKEA